MAPRCQVCITTSCIHNWMLKKSRLVTHCLDIHNWTCFLVMKTMVMVDSRKETLMNMKWFRLVWQWGWLEVTVRLIIPTAGSGKTSSCTTLKYQSKIKHCNSETNSSSADSTPHASYLQTCHTFNASSSSLKPQHWYWLQRGHAHHIVARPDSSRPHNPTSNASKTKGSNEGPWGLSGLEGIPRPCTQYSLMLDSVRVISITIFISWWQCVFYCCPWSRGWLLSGAPLWWGQSVICNL
jgi:hypothetical protein